MEAAADGGDGGGGGGRSWGRGVAGGGGGVVVDMAAMACVYNGNGNWHCMQEARNTRRTAQYSTLNTT